MDHAPLPIRWLLLAVAAVLCAVAVWLPPDADGVAGPIAALFALALAWVVTRPWHPVIAPLYRRRLQAAYEDWTEAVERHEAHGAANAAAEVQLATEHFALRLEALRPPAAEQDTHTRRIEQAVEYADALHAWRQAPDDPHASARLQAAHDALG